MSLTCHEEIGRVRSVGLGCYEDASDLSEASRACQARGSLRTTRHTDKRAVLYTAADRRPTKQISAWQAERGGGKSPDMRDILVASWRGCRAYRASRRGCHEDATRKLLPLNLGFSARARRTSPFPTARNDMWSGLWPPYVISL